jgi:hypothetical protein
MEGDARGRGAALEIVTMYERDGIVTFGRTPLGWAQRPVDIDAIV